jgi:hypothetical protein
MGEVVLKVERRTHSPVNSKIYFLPFLEKKED